MIRMISAICAAATLAVAGQASAATYVYNVGTHTIPVAGLATLSNFEPLPTSGETYFAKVEWSGVDLTEITLKFIYRFTYEEYVASGHFQYNDATIETVCNETNGCFQRAGEGRAMATFRPPYFEPRPCEQTPEIYPNICRMFINPARDQDRIFFASFTQENDPVITLSISDQPFDLPPPPPIPGVVPEPSTWAAMIAGLVMTGAGLRRRRGRAVGAPRDLYRPLRGGL